ncbi:DUF4167 domain-containing protein [Reyranella sp.]|jgi:hypothetical protein|uniref:DUF4167 domain-containing protein n=1 Tax=Reyranella sp. TaxID=1929291 RepID=UPI002F934F91
MRPNNRQRSRGGRSGGGGGSHGHHKQHHNPNRPPNRNQIFDSSGPDVRVRGNAHQVFDKYQALAREAAASGDRIMAEAYWQYADHYFRVIQTMGGFTHRNNQGWGEGSSEEGQQGSPQQPGQSPQPAQANGNGAGYTQDDRNANRDEERGETEPGLGGVAFLQNGRGTPANPDPAAEDQPDVPDFTPTAGRRG